jgi:hypothetical protein
LIDSLQYLLREFDANLNFLFSHGIEFLRFDMCSIVAEKPQIIETL